MVVVGLAIHKQDAMPRPLVVTVEPDQSPAVEAHPRLSYSWDMHWGILDFDNPLPYNKFLRHLYDLHHGLE